MLSIRQKVVDILFETFPEDFKFVRLKTGDSLEINTYITPAIGPDSQVYVSRTELGIYAGFNHYPTNTSTSGAWIGVALPLDYEKAALILLARLRTLMLVMPEDACVSNSVDLAETALRQTKELLKKE